MTNEQRARQIMSAWSILFSEETDRLGYTPQKLASQIAQALSEKDAIISEMREALEEQLKWKPNYLNDDGSVPDICDSDSWDDVSSHELRDILADVFTTAKEALSKLKETT